MTTYNYDRTKTAGGSMWPSVDPTPHYVAVWIELDSYGRVHHVTGDLKQAEKNLEKPRSAIVAAQQELGKTGLHYSIGDIIVDGSSNTGRNKMVVYFSITPVGQKFSDVEQGMIMSKLVGVSSGEQKLPL
jgi:hypothetical protein